MIYSEWDPVSGGYTYFEAAFAPNMNDDLPTPDLPHGTSLGVPSVEAGRPLPGDAREVGTGDLARGVVTPLDPARIVRRTRSLAGLDPNQARLAMWGAAAAGGALLYWVIVSKKLP